MSKLPGAVTLSRLSLPGTHDTGAYNSGGMAVVTQTMNVSQQLKAGIRAWDMRLGYNLICPGPLL